jgi:hypothetical protein
LHLRDLHLSHILQKRENLIIAGCYDEAILKTQGDRLVSFQKRNAMRFVSVVLVIAALSMGTMYFRNPTQFNGMLARFGITSWHAPEAASASNTPAAATDNTATKAN